MRVHSSTLFGVSMATFGFGYLQALAGSAHPGWFMLAGLTLFITFLASLE
jgi:hypothetical protein